MLLDLMNSENYISFNIELAHKVGLESAVYCAELLNIYKKAYNKKKLIDNEYIKLDRNYIYDKTSLLIEDQLRCDLNLIKINLIKKNKDNPDVIKLDIQLLASIISSDDIKLKENIKELVTKKSPKGLKESSRQYMISELKNSIVCSNYELLTALRGWVDGVYANPKGFLSKQSIKLFQDTLNNYTQGDLDLALRIVNIATIQGYRDCQWAINSYEDDLKIKKKNLFQYSTVNTQVRTTEQVKADKLSNDIF